MFPVSFHTALQKLKVSKSVKSTNMGTSSLLPAGFNHQADQLEVPLTLGKLSPYIFDDQNFSFLASYLWQGPSVRVKKVSRCFTYYVCIHNILTCMDYSDVQTATVYNKHVKKKLFQIYVTVTDSTTILWNGPRLFASITLRFPNDSSLATQNQLSISIPVCC